MSLSKLVLPWTKHTKRLSQVDPAWLVKTRVALSPTAGMKRMGRFLLKDVAKGTALKRVQVVYATQIGGEGYNWHNVLESDDTLIVFSHMQQVENMMDVMLEPVDDKSDVLRTELMAELVHYMADFDGGHKCGLLTRSAQTNHAVDPSKAYCDGFCREEQVRNDMLQLVACRDLVKGEELLIDYNKWTLPPFWQRMCANYGVPTLHQHLEIIYGSI